MRKRPVIVKGPAMVMVSSPGCPACLAAKPAWNHAIKTLGTNIAMAYYEDRREETGISDERVKRGNQIIAAINAQKEIEGWPSAYYFEADGTMHEMPFGEYNYTEEGEYERFVRDVRNSTPSTPPRSLNTRNQMTYNRAINQHAALIQGMTQRGNGTISSADTAILIARVEATMGLEPKTILKSMPARTSFVSAMQRFHNPPAAQASRASGCTSGRCSAKNTAEWGPKLWAEMHVAALAFPQNPTQTEKKNAIKYFKGIPARIECNTCKEHYIEMINTPGPLRLGSKTVASRDALFEWTVRIHAAVNVRLGKPALDDVEMWRTAYKIALNKLNNRARLRIQSVYEG